MSGIGGRYGVDVVVEDEDVVIGVAVSLESG